MNKKFLLLGIILLAGMIGCTPASRIDSGSIEVRNENINARVVFHEKDRATIIDYYSHARKAKNLPPGLAKKDTLPPGLQKHIVKHGELPQGLEGRSLPYELEKKLTPLPEASRPRATARRPRAAPRCRPSGAG